MKEGLEFSRLVLGKKVSWRLRRVAGPPKAKSKAKVTGMVQTAIVTKPSD